MTLPVAAQAQNYVHPSRYATPDVIVNLDVLGSNAPVNPMMQRIQPLLPPQQPVVMQPPPGYQPPPMPTPMAPQPVMNNELAAPMPKQVPAPVAPPPEAAPDFNASDLAAMTPPAAPIPVEEKAPVEQVKKSPEKPILSPVMLAAKAPSPSVPTVEKGRTLLAQARDDAQVDNDKPAMRNTVLFDENAPPAPVTGKEELATKTAAVAPQQLAPMSATVKPSSSSEAVGQEKDTFEAYRILFDADKTELKPAERAQLDKVVAKLKRNEDVQVQLLAYANGTPDTASKARRTSLTRAMEVRNYLLQAGILANRLDVRALGMGSTAMQDSARNRNIPADRVDMIFGKKDAG